MNRPDRGRIEAGQLKKEGSGKDIDYLGPVKISSTIELNCPLQRKC